MKCGKKTCLFAVVILFVCIWFIAFFEITNQTIYEPCSISLDDTIANARSAAEALSLDDYVALDTAFDAYFQCQADERIYAKYGMPDVGIPSKKIFSEVYSNDFDPFENMYVNGTKIGILFKGGSVYSEDYGGWKVRSGIALYVEYGICCIL